MPYDPKIAAEKAQLIKFAYNMFEGAPLSLTPQVDPGVSAAGYDLLFYLSAHDLQTVKFYGYLAASQASPGDLVLVIRGTETAAEWFLNFDALPLPYLGKGFVPAGFRSIAESFQLLDSIGAAKGNISTVLTSLNAVTPITSVTVLGHSLGGALATLAAAQIAFSGTPTGGSLSMWTYASPRVALTALPDFMVAFNHAVPNSYRIWNELDVVPLFPPFPYVHVGQSQKLSQTQSQLEHLKMSAQCEHHLTSYEWLLDPTDFSPDNDCVVVPAVRVAAAAVGFQPAVAPVSEFSLGAKAFLNALNQQ